MKIINGDHQWSMVDGQSRQIGVAGPESPDWSRPTGVAGPESPDWSRRTGVAGREAPDGSLRIGLEFWGALGLAFWRG